MYSQEMFNKRKKWYELVANKFNLLMAMRDREVILMSKSNPQFCIRGLIIRNIPALDTVFDMFNFFKKDYNIYVSITKYNSFPQFTTDLKLRSTETREFFQNYNKHDIMNFDIFLDFDSELIGNDFILMCKEVETTINWLEYFKIQFRVFPSGTNYQIVIENSNYDLEKIAKVLKNLKNRLGLGSLDMANVGVYNKIRKCEYSLVNDICCLPLQNPLAHFRNGVYTDYRTIFDSNYILKTNSLLRRGLKNQNTEENLNNRLDYMFKKLGCL